MFEHAFVTHGMLGGVGMCVCVCVGVCVCMYNFDVYFPMLFYLMFVFLYKGVHHFQALASYCISSIFLLLLVVFYDFVMMENKNTMTTMTTTMTCAVLRIQDCPVKSLSFIWNK